MAMAISYGFISKTGSKQHKEAALAMKHGVTSHVSYKSLNLWEFKQRKERVQMEKGALFDFSRGVPHEKLKNEKNGDMWL